MHPVQPPQPPGSRASFHLGLWSLISALTLLLPVAIGLGIAAIVTNRRAVHRAEAAPESYAKPASTGLILGIVSLCIAPVMLVFLGIVSAIAIPALLGQRARARDKAAISNLTGSLADLVGTYDKAAGKRMAPEQIRQEMETTLQQQNLRNPWNPAQPAWDHRIKVCEGLDREAIREAAEAQATVLGQGVFLVQFSAGPQAPALLAGATRLQTPVSGKPLVSKVVELE